MPQLTDLPPELLQRVLLDLSAGELYSCTRTCRSLYEVIKGSVAIQYKMRLETSGMVDVDVPSSQSLSISEKLGSVNDREERWMKFEPLFKKTVEIDFTPGSIYDISSSCYVLLEENRKAIRILNLPQPDEGDAKWRRIDLGESDALVIDLGLCIKEHDLLAIVTQSLSSGTQSVRFVQFSTGQPHPLASGPQITLKCLNTLEILLSPEILTSVYLEIVGNVCVIVSVDRAHEIIGGMLGSDDIRTKVYMIDWKKGTVLQKWSREHGSYLGPLFLSETILLFPNCNSENIEVYDLSSLLDPERRIEGEDTLDPLLFLSLPPTNEEYKYRHIESRAEPNPRGSLISSHSIEETAGARGSIRTRPFDSSPGSAVIIFSLKLITSLHRQLYGFCLFVKRIHLLNFIESCLEALNSCPQGSRIEYEFSEWGSGACHITSSESFITRWITMGNGERVCLLKEEDFEQTLFDLVQTNDNSLDDEEDNSGAAPIVKAHRKNATLESRLFSRMKMMDFNIHNLRRLEYRLMSMPEEEKWRWRVKRRPTVLSDPHGIFKNEIWNKLKYIEYWPELSVQELEDGDTNMDSDYQPESDDEVVEMIGEEDIEILDDENVEFSGPDLGATEIADDSEDGWETEPANDANSSETQMNGQGAAESGVDKWKGALLDDGAIIGIKTDAFSDKVTALEVWYFG